MLKEAMTAFDATSTGPLRNRKLQTFDFNGLVDAFDAARAGSPVISNWAPTHALLAKRLSGGDLAYYTGAQGSYAGMGAAGTQNVLGNPQTGHRDGAWLAGGQRAPRMTQHQQPPQKIPSILNGT